MTDGETNRFTKNNLNPQSELAPPRAEHVAEVSTPRLVRYVTFQNIRVLHRIVIEDIMYCESVNRQINIYCTQFDHLNVPNVRLDDLENLLPTSRFVRIGRSHILNWEAIVCLNKTEARCWLMWQGRLREVMIYMSNIDKLTLRMQQDYSVDGRP